MPNPIRRSKIERYSERETLAKIATILHFDARQASGDMKQAVFQGALDSLAKGDMLLKADIEYRMSVLRPRKTSETSETKDIAPLESLPVINYTRSLRINPYADPNPYLALLLYGPKNFPIAMQYYNVGSYKAMIPLIQRYHPGTKPRSMSDGHSMYEYIVQHAGKDYDRVLNGEIPVSVDTAKKQAYYYDKARGDVGQVQHWPPPEQEKAAAGRRQEIKLSDIKPIRRVEGFSLSVNKPLDPYLLYEAYGPQQYHTILSNILTMEQLRGAVHIVRTRHPELPPPHGGKLASRGALVDYLLSHVPESK